jgi:hypothetical protein
MPVKTEAEEEGIIRQRRNDKLKTKTNQGNRVVNDAQEGNQVSQEKVKEKSELQ